MSLIYNAIVFSALPTEAEARWRRNTHTHTHALRDSSKPKRKKRMFSRYVSMYDKIERKKCLPSICFHSHFGCASRLVRFNFRLLLLLASTITCTGIEIHFFFGKFQHVNLECAPINFLSMRACFGVPSLTALTLCSCSFVTYSLRNINKINSPNCVNKASSTATADASKRIYLLQSKYNRKAVLV